MYINRITCTNCYGTGKTQEWVMAETNPDGTGMLKVEECVCGNCNGKGYTKYSVFTVEEAKVIAEHFGFEVLGDDTYD